MIYVDSNENSKSNIPGKLRQLGVPVEVKNLKVGDYWIGDCMIERKTIDDFFSSIFSGDRRYYRQVYNLSINTKKPMVYVVGTYPRNVPVRKVGNKTISIDVESALRKHKIITYYSFRVPVFQVPSEDDFIKELIEIHYKSGKTPLPRPLDIVRKPETIEDIRTNIYGSIPGMGRITANYLAKHYPLHTVFNMTLKELSEIRIGDKKLGKKANILYNVLHDSNATSEVVL